MIGGNITYIEEELLSVLAKHYPIQYIKIKASYLYVGKSFDLLIACLNYSISHKKRLDLAVNEILAKNNNLDIEY